MLGFVFFIALLCSKGAAAADSKPHYWIKAAHFAACSALQALDEMDMSEATALNEEVQKVERSVSVGKSPISVGETLHDTLGLHLDMTVAALRHALASGVLNGAAELAEFSALDKQISALMSLQDNEPLFFWHGPRRWLLPRVRNLLRGQSIQEHLRTADVDCEKLRDEIDLGILLGNGAVSAGDETPAKEVMEHGIPQVGVVVDDNNCGDGQTCDLKAASETIGAHKTHVLVQASSHAALTKIGVALENAPDVWLSFAIPERFVENEQADIGQIVMSRLNTLGRKSLDLCWLPYAAFPKKVWPRWKAQLEKLLKQGAIGAYGVQANVASLKVAEGLFTNREPAPVAWLTHHDLFRAAHADAVAVARKQGMAIVAQPRPRAAANKVAAAYLQVATGQKSSDHQAAHYGWILQSGFSLALQITPGEEAVLQNMHESKVSKKGLQLLAAVSHFSHAGAPEEASPLELEPDEPQQKEGLLQRLQYWQRRAAKEKAPESQLATYASPTLSSATGFVPGVSTSTLASLDEQAVEYRDNKHVIYKPDFFDEPTWSAIVNETKRLWKSHEIEGNCNLDGTNRLGGYVLDHKSPDSSLYKLIYGNEAFRKWVSAVNAEGTMWPSDFPIEVREYGTGSAGMGCHSDLLMYAVAKKDLEFAVTVDNDSKCMVSFYDAQNTKHEVKTKPNSVMMVRANAARHCVSSTSGGTRTIIKFIYVGDYKKSKGFVHFKESHEVTECEPENFNDAMLKTRREYRSEL